MIGVKIMVFFNLAAPGVPLGGGRRSARAGKPAEWLRALSISVLLAHGLAGPRAAKLKNTMILTRVMS